MESQVSRETPRLARRLYPDAVEELSAYAEWLASDGVARGLIGPREAPRLWDRHLLNCAVLERLIASEATVADIGSGAGLPGLVLAIVRPDLAVTLIEPLLRRTTFLIRTVEELGLPNVEVVRSRAQAVRRRTFDVVTSRALAPLGTVVEWSLPLCRPDGLVLAIKGSSAADELEAVAADLDRLGAGERTIQRLGVDELDQPTIVVTIVARPAGQAGHETASGR